MFGVNFSKFQFISLLNTEHVGLTVQSDPVISKRVLRIKSLLNNFNQKIPSGVEINNSQPNHGEKWSNAMYFVIYNETKGNKNIFWKVLRVSALAVNVTYVLFLLESLSWREQEKGKQGKKVEKWGPEGETVRGRRSQVTNSSAGWGKAGPGCTRSGCLSAGSASEHRKTLWAQCQQSWSA